MNWPWMSRGLLQRMAAGVPTPRADVDPAASTTPAGRGGAEESIEHFAWPAGGHRRMEQPGRRSGADGDSPASRRAMWPQLAALMSVPVGQHRSFAGSAE